MTIEIEDIKKVNLQPGETLVIQINCKNIPSNRKQDYLQNATKLWRQVFPDPAINIVAIPPEVSLTVISSTPTPRVMKPDLLKSQPVDQTDYERAMEIIK